MTADTMSPSPRAANEFQSCRLRIGPPTAAFRLWEYLTPQEKLRLGNDFEVAYRDNGGTAGMWKKLRGVTYERAVIDVATKIGFLTEENYKWLLREAGEFLDAEEAIAAAVAAEHFVLVARPRRAHWRGRELEIDWHKHSASWEFLWEVARHAKARRPVDRFCFGEESSENIIAKRKSHLTRLPNVPYELGNLIEPEGIGTQRLRFPPEQIRVFEISGIDELEEWFP